MQEPNAVRIARGLQVYQKLFSLEGRHLSFTAFYESQYLEFLERDHTLNRNTWCSCYMSECNISLSSRSSVAVQCISLQLPFSVILKAILQNLPKSLRHSRTLFRSFQNLIKNFGIFFLQNFFQQN